MPAHRKMWIVVATLFVLLCVVGTVEARAIPQTTTERTEGT